MLDVHPPHEAAHTWKDFFIHIATICVGLLIAIGLEQSVESLHHHHQREDLEQQMQDESAANLRLVQDQIDYAQQLKGYLSDCLRTLHSATAADSLYTIMLPPNRVELPKDAHSMLISPSRGTWTVAKAAGTVALLPAETAKIYARLDLAEEFEQEAERTDTADVDTLQAQRVRLASSSDPDAPLHLTDAQRDDLLLAYGHLQTDNDTFIFRLAIVKGALQAVRAHVHTLEEMYPYQGKAVSESFGFPGAPIVRQGASH
jgi:hypothetical protein